MATDCLRVATNASTLSLESHELESLAGQRLGVGDAEFADPPPSVKELLKHRSLHDVKESITYLLPVGTNTTMPIATTEAQAARSSMTIIVPSRRVAKQGNSPFWKIGPVESDKDGLYFVVTVSRTDTNRSLKMIYVVPRESMLSDASSPTHSWFETVHQSEQYIWPAAPPSTIRPRPGVHVVLGDAARSDRESFAAACDVFAYFMAYYALVIIDRDVHESAESMTWSGRCASLRRNKTRFFELGGGGFSNAGGGGWDFHRLTLSCDRSTGALTMSAEPITFAVTPLEKEILAPAWVTEELKRMGWKPLETIDFFDAKLLPPEYSDAVDRFNPDNVNEVRALLHRRWIIEKSLPQPSLVLGVLFDRAGRREEALKFIQHAATEGKNEPGTLADVARLGAKRRQECGRSTTR